MNVELRELRPGDAEIVRLYLYLAVFVPEGHPPVPASVLDQPEIARYASGWGRSGDLGLLAVDPASGGDVGAAWLRLWLDGDTGYGFVDLATPELCMAVRPEWRGQGVGTLLLSELLRRADSLYDTVSLSVSNANPAQRLYERAGFLAVASDDDSTTMVRRRSAIVGDGPTK